MKNNPLTKTQAHIWAITDLMHTPPPDEGGRRMLLAFLMLRRAAFLAEEVAHGQRRHHSSPFRNESALDFRTLANSPDAARENLHRYILGFPPETRAIFDAMGLDAITAHFDQRRLLAPLLAAVDSLEVAPKHGIGNAVFAELLCRTDAASIATSRMKDYHEEAGRFEEVRLAFFQLLDAHHG